MAKIEEFDNLPGNSAASKDEKAAEPVKPATITPVAAGKRREKTKKRGMKKFADALFSVDDRPKMNITEDIVIPAVKNTFLDVISAVTGAVTNAFEIALFGDMHGRTRARDRRDRDRYRNGYIDYSSSSSRRGSEDRRGSDRGSSRSRDLQDFTDVDFDTWEEANDVLTNMKDLLNRYDRYVTVADFYALAGISYTYQDRNWGWTDLSNAYPIRDGAVYILVLPKPEYIK